MLHEIGVWAGGSEDALLPPAHLADDLVPGSVAEVHLAIVVEKCCMVNGLLTAELLQRGQGQEGHTVLGRKTGVHINV